MLVEGRSSRSIAISTLPSKAAPSNGRISVTEAVRSILVESAYRSLGSLKCDYDSGVLTLYGTLPTFYLKQVAQTLVAEAPGVTVVRNLIQVHYVGNVRN